MSCVNYYKDSIVVNVEKHGQIEVARELIREIFPEPDPMVNALLATYGHRPEMTSKEAIDFLCEQHGLEYVELPNGNLLFRRANETQ